MFIILSLLNIFLFVRMGRNAFRWGSGKDPIGLGAYFSVLCITTVVNLVGAALLNPDDTGARIFGAVVGIILLSMLVGLLSLLVGLAFRPARAPVYLSMNGEQSGPFTMRHIRAMKKRGEITGDAFFYDEQEAIWTPLSDSWLDRLKKALLALPVPRLAMVVAAFVILTGISFYFINTRYTTQAMGGGVMMKTDRWTGESWTTHRTTGHWVPVKEAK